MRQVYKKLGVCGGLCLSLLAGCSEDKAPPKVVPKIVQAPVPNILETITARGKLIVGVKRVQTVVNSLNTQQEVTGLEADVSKLFAEMLLHDKKRVYNQLVLPQSVANTLLGRQVDLMVAGLSRQELDELKGVKMIPLPASTREVAEESDATPNFVILVRPSDAALIEQVNKFVARLKDTGEYAKLYDLWITKPLARETVTTSGHAEFTPTVEQVPTNSEVVLPRPESPRH